jgi:hypothetical protein
MLDRTKKYLKAALYNAVARPLQQRLLRLEEREQRILNQVAQLSRHFQVPTAHHEDGVDRFFTHLVWDKLFVIDYACQMMRVQSFADLGGAWCEYEGGYSFYTMEKHRVSTGVLVDGYSTEKLVEDVQRHVGLRFLHDDFNKPEVAAQVGDVDVVFLFDVLYVQANPGWEQLLEMYAPRTRCMLISNVHFPLLPHTVRLLDLGKDEYFKYVPATKDSGGYKHLFEKLDEIHPQYRVRYRDCHHYWQWAMTDHDLLDKMTRLGFRLHYLRTAGKRDDISYEAESRVFAFFKDTMRLPCRP